MGVQYPKFVIKALETMREKNDSAAPEDRVNTVPDTGKNANETGNSDTDSINFADETSTFDNDSGISADETGKNVVDLDR